MIIICSYMFNSFSGFSKIRFNVYPPPNPDNREPSYYCKLCVHSCNSKTDYISHVLSHADVQSCVCPVCGKVFSSKSNLGTHVLLHSDMYFYKCLMCGKEFTQKGNLKRHMISHNKFL